MKQLIHAVSLVVSLALTPLAAHAGFVENLNAKFPDTKGAKVEKAFGDFYSIVKGNEVLFINENLSILINGEVLDLNAQKSITSTLKALNRPKVAITDLKLNDAIKFGNGPEKIYVFSDPDCPYCRQLEREFDKLPGVSIYVFPFPLASLHPNAEVISESIWCAKDRAKVWHNYLLNRTTPAAGSCENPISRNIALAEKYQIMGTPAIIFSDGTVIPGAVPAAKIQEQIAKSKAK